MPDNLSTLSYNIKNTQYKENNINDVINGHGTHRGKTELLMKYQLLNTKHRLEMVKTIIGKDFHFLGLDTAWAYKTGNT